MELKNKRIETSLPADWTPSEKTVEYIGSLGYLGEMVNHLVKKMRGFSEACDIGKVDWDKELRNWADREVMPKNIGR